MSYETEEQQVERLKEWWSENGTPLIVGAVLGLAGFGGWKYWNSEKIQYESAASDAYKTVVTALDKNEKDAVMTHAETVINEYGDSTYAILAALVEAKELVAKADLDAAAGKLRWIMDNHKRNELAEIAKLRLARILAQQEKLDEALALLNTDGDSAYSAMANWIKGDLLLAAGRNDEALIALKIAAEDEKLSAGDPTLKLKIDQLEAANLASNSQAEAVKPGSASEQAPAESIPAESTPAETNSDEKKGAE